MIQATFKKKNGELYGYKVEGHANFSAVGTDIVCAGVSSLYSTVTYTLDLLGRTFEKDDGSHFVVDGGEKEAICLQILYEGIQAIASEYPDYCRVEVIE